MGDGRNTSSVLTSFDTNPVVKFKPESKDIDRNGHLVNLSIKGLEVLK